jgi:hypothetical protein
MLTGTSVAFGNFLCIRRRKFVMKVTTMRLVGAAFATAFLLWGPIASAQSSAGAPGTPRPAANSENAAHDTTGMAPSTSRSGSGTSTSGGRDANNDQGRDTMPDSNKSVIPLDQQHKPAK